jgi:hypothetical protein
MRYATAAPAALPVSERPLVELLEALVERRVRTAFEDKPF